MLFRSVVDNGFTIDVDILKGIAAGVFAAGDTLYITYSALLTEEAVVAGGSNDNTVYLEYSNDPYGNGTGETIEITVKDYTFKLNVTKTNSNNEALTGAEFILSTENGLMYFKETLGTTNTYVVCADKHDHSATTVCTSTITTGTEGKFEFVGLDDQVTYYLTETKAPEGYNLLTEPVRFVITATYENGNITSVSATSSLGEIKADGNFQLSTDIVNVAGNKLPETGGTGTKVFTVAGASMMVLAAVVLVAKRRVRG